MEIQREEHFGTVERIREWKENSGITWEQFADRVGVSYKGVKRWINKKSPTPIRAKNLAKIAEVMDCDIEYLECKQSTPRKSNTKISLAPISLQDRYLPKIQSLMETTATSFTYKYDPELIVHGTEIEGFFIEGETRYYFTDYVFDNEISEIFYQVCINGSGPVRISEQRMNLFVKSILRKTAKEIEDLKEEKEMYPNVTKEMNRNNITAEELAQAIGADPVELIEALRGEKDFTFAQASKIKKALGSELPIEDLFDTAN